ncbi:MAG: photosystem I assembly protein Ycf3 [Pelotomaculum sp. PtaU1.Bin035]|nr:MAG: photosystem I assembly protein Ycf3 [Pelotomaculum sp. PtaU1.Bin035]
MFRVEELLFEYFFEYIDELRRKGQIESAIDGVKKFLSVMEGIWGDINPYYLKIVNGLAMTYHSIGRMKEAEPLYLKAVNQAQINGEEKEDYLFYLNNLALLYQESGRLKEAEPLFKKLVELTLKTVGRKHIKYADCLHNLGYLYYSLGQFKTAKNMLLKSLEITREILGDKNSSYANGLESLLEFYISTGDLAEAKKICRKALKLRRIIKGKRTPEYARCLNKLAAICQIKGKYKTAELIYRRVIKIDIENKKEGHPNFGVTLQSLAELYKALGRYEKSEAMYIESLKINRAVLGDLHMNVARCIYDLAALYMTAGRYQESEALFSQAIDIKSKIVGEKNYEYASSLNGLAELYTVMGRYREAEQLIQRAITINEEALGDRSLEYAVNINDLANLYAFTGRFNEAEELHKIVAGIRYDILGGMSKGYAIAMNNLAYLYFLMGRYEESGELYKEALLIICKILGRDNSDYATCLNGQAMVGYALGQYEEAEALYVKALEIKRSIAGEMHPEYATNLCNLAMLYHNTERYYEAEQKYLRVLVIRRMVLGDRHPDLAVSLNNLAVLYIDMGKYSESELLLNAAGKIIFNVLGEEHSLYAFNLNNLAWLCQNTGQYRKAEGLYLKSAQKMLHALGDKHPDYAAVLSSLGWIKAATGQYGEALRYLSESVKINDMLLERLAAYLPEQQLLSFASKLEGETFLLLSFVWRCLKDNNDAVKIASDTVIKRKAIVYEATAVQHQAAITRKYPRLEGIFIEMKQVHNELAGRMLSGPADDEDIETFKTNLECLDNRLKELQSQIAKQVPQIDIQMRLQGADRRAISNSLPPNAILIEFIRFIPVTFAATENEEYEPARYIAFIVASEQPEKTILLDFGTAEEIDFKINNFRKIIMDGADNRGHGDLGLATGLIKDECRILYDMLFMPVAEVLHENNLKKTDHIIIAPDGEICQVPFEAFVSPRDRFIIEDYNISYVTVGRDIVRFGVGYDGADEAVIIADPDYNLTKPEEGTENIQWQRGGLLSKLRGRGKYFPPLPLTRREGKKVAERVSGMGLKVREFYGKKASKKQVKEVAAPKILHIATHGFFLPDKERPVKMQLRGIIDKRNMPEYIKSSIFKHNLENPLLRSGLVFAGVNIVLSGGKPPEEAEDGILTALEVMTMDLTGTELVALSACQSGMGEVRCGEGVAGLRKSFILGGARTILISLWEVPDFETLMLMESFYTSVFRGEDKSAALRMAKLELINRLRKGNEFVNPWYWAGFICQGDTLPIQQ